MTQSPVASAELVARLRERGLRMTAQRQFVLDAVRDLGHATPEEVFEVVEHTAPGINITTVYRTLELLQQIGMLTHTHLGSRAPTYHWPQPDGHVHLVCRECGQVLEISPEHFDGVRAAVAADPGFTLDVAHISLFGVCHRCQPDEG